MGLPVILGLAGTAISAVGAIGAGQAQSAQASYEAQVARNNQTIANQNANYATAAGETKAYDQGLRQRAKAGAITAGIAANNINVNTGSAEQVRQSQAEIGQQDVETVRQQAALTAYGYRTQSTNFQAQSQLDTAQAGFDAEAGWIKGLGAGLLGGAKFGGGFGGGGSGISGFGGAAGAAAGGYF